MWPLGSWQSNAFQEDFFHSWAVQVQGWETHLSMGMNFVPKTWSMLGVQEKPSLKYTDLEANLGIRPTKR
jgi:hypothetical protein